MRHKIWLVLLVALSVSCKADVTAADEDLGSFEGSIQTAEGSRHFSGSGEWWQDRNLTNGPPVIGYSVALNAVDGDTADAIEFGIGVTEASGAIPPGEYPIAYMEMDHQFSGSRHQWLQSDDSHRPVGTQCAFVSGSITLSDVPRPMPGSSMLEEGHWKGSIDADGECVPGDGPFWNPFMSGSPIHLSVTFDLPESGGDRRGWGAS